jgi:hypothetical protein
MRHPSFCLRFFFDVLVVEVQSKRENDDRKSERDNPFGDQRKIAPKSSDKETLARV